MQQQDRKKKKEKRDWIRLCAACPGCLVGTWLHLLVVHPVMMDNGVSMCVHTGAQQRLHTHICAHAPSVHANTRAPAHVDASAVCARTPVLVRGRAHVCARTRGGNAGFNHFGAYPEHLAHPQLCSPENGNKTPHACALTQLTPLWL